MSGLKIFVCLKPVPDPEKWPDIELDPQTRAIQRKNINQIINPLDKNALEAALVLREKLNGTVEVITMGPPGARQNIIEALAIGADRGILLSDPAFAGADTLATSYTLSAGILAASTRPPDIVLCGAKSLDGSTAQVGPQLAVHLKYHHATSISSIKILGPDKLGLRMQLENGFFDLAAPPPLVITVNGNCNRPRTATLMGIMEAENKEIITLSASDISADPDRIGLRGSPTRAADIFFPNPERKGEILTGEPAEIVKLLLDKLAVAGTPRLQ